VCIESFGVTSLKKPRQVFVPVVDEIVNQTADISRDSSAGEMLSFGFPNSNPKIFVFRIAEGDSEGVFRCEECFLKLHFEFHDISLEEAIAFAVTGVIRKVTGCCFGVFLPSYPLVFVTLILGLCPIGTIFFGFSNSELAGFLQFHVFLLCPHKKSHQDLGQIDHDDYENGDSSCCQHSFKFRFVVVVHFLYLQVSDYFSAHLHEQF
jgi:hypothetical protein